MSCEQWKEALAARLYDEAEGSEELGFSAHLESCEDCRRELSDLGEVRRMLREAEPVAPAAPRVMILAPRRARPSWLAFAAGFACAAVLLGSGLAAGWTLAARATAGAVASSATVPAAQHDEEGLASLRKRLEEQDDRIRALQASFPSREILTRQEFEGGLTRLRNDLDHRRSQDLGLMLREIAGVELRTGARIGQTQDALRYYALASNPGISAQ